VWYGRRHKLL